MNQAKRDAVLWFKQNEPFIYAVAKKRVEMENTLNGVDWGGMFDKLTTTVTNVAPQYLQYKQQKKVMSMQLDRAKKGLPPANVEDYSPVIRIAPTITPETEQAITRAAVSTSQSAAKKMVPILALGGIGLYLIMNKRKRR